MSNSFADLFRVALSNVTEVQDLPTQRKLYDIAKTVYELKDDVVLSSKDLDSKLGESFEVLVEKPETWLTTSGRITLRFTPADEGSKNKISFSLTRMYSTNIHDYLVFSYRIGRNGYVILYDRNTDNRYLASSYMGPWYHRSSGDDWQGIVKFNKELLHSVSYSSHNIIQKFLLTTMKVCLKNLNDNLAIVLLEEINVFISETLPQYRERAASDAAKNKKRLEELAKQFKSEFHGNKK